MTRQEAEAFVIAYKSVFETLDPTRISALYTIPCFGLTGGETHAFCTESDLHQNFVSVTTQFHAAGFASADYELLEHTQISDAILQIPVRWVLRRTDGSVLKSLHVVYVVRVIGPDWRIAAVYGVS